VNRKKRNDSYHKKWRCKKVGDKFGDRKWKIHGFWFLKKKRKERSMTHPHSLLSSICDAMSFRVSSLFHYDHRHHCRIWDCGCQLIASFDDTSYQILAFFFFIENVSHEDLLFSVTFIQDNKGALRDGMYRVSLSMLSFLTLLFHVRTCSFFVSGIRGRRDLEG
jgi:hypothetical protein